MLAARTLALLGVLTGSTSLLSGCGGPSGFAPPGPTHDAAADAPDPDAGTFGDGGGASCHHSTLTSKLPGPDGVLGTADDVTGGITDFDYEQGKGDKGDGYSTISTFRVVRYFAHGNPAIDMRWSYKPNGARDRVTQMAPGPDGQPGTPDDTVTAMNVYEIGTDGLLSRNLFRSSPGPDGVWATSDDPITNAWHFSSDGGYLRYMVPANAPGPDGVWGTADDPGTSSVRIERVRGRFSAEEICDQTGPDGVFGTADDVVKLRLVLPCRGDDVVYESYTGAGPDGQWGTADDVLASRTLESGDRCMRAACGIVVPF